MFGPDSDSYKPVLLARVRRRAKNVFMPANINCVAIITLEGDYSLKDNK
jgi:hypothetical protein